MKIRTEMGVTSLTTTDRHGNARIIRVRETDDGRFRISNAEGGSLTVHPEASNVIEVGVGDD